MTNEQKKQFFKAQSRTETGQQWLAILQEMVSELYNSKSKTMDQVALDQRVATVIEETLIKPILLGNQDLRPQKNKEYI